MTILLHFKNQKWDFGTLGVFYPTSLESPVLQRKR